MWPERNLQKNVYGHILGCRVLQSVLYIHVQLILQKHSDVFQEGLGTLTGFKVNLNIIDNPFAPPKYCKAHTVVYFLHDKIETELNCLVTEGT